MQLLSCVLLNSLDRQQLLRLLLPGRGSSRLGALYKVIGGFAERGLKTPPTPSEATRLLPALLCRAPGGDTLPLAGVGVQLLGQRLPQEPLEAPCLRSHLGSAEGAFPARSR